MKISDIIKAMKTTCGARTRCGGPCKNAPIGDMGRGRMHAGKSLSGIAHPYYKHGKYSKVFLARLIGSRMAHSPCASNDGHEVDGGDGIAEYRIGPALVSEAEWKQRLEDASANSYAIEVLHEERHE